MGHHMCTYIDTLMCMYVRTYIGAITIRSGPVLWNRHTAAAIVSTVITYLYIYMGNPVITTGIVVCVISISSTM